MRRIITLVICVTKDCQLHFLVAPLDHAEEVVTALYAGS